MQNYLKSNLKSYTRIYNKIFQIKLVDYVPVIYVCLSLFGEKIER